MTTNEVPDDADFVLINAPSSDIFRGRKKKNMLENYFDNGGKLLVMAWEPVESGDLPEPL